MKSELADPNKWWDQATPDEKTFIRTILRYTAKMNPQNVLEVVFNGRNFTPTMRGDPVCVNPDDGLDGPADPELWWASLPPAKKAFSPEVMKLVQILLKDQRKAIEIENTGRSFKIALVLKFAKPVGVKATTN